VVGGCECFGREDDSIGEASGRVAVGGSGVCTICEIWLCSCFESTDEKSPRYDWYKVHTGQRKALTRIQRMEDKKQRRETTNSYMLRSLIFPCCGPIIARPSTPSRKWVCVKRRRSSRKTCILVRLCGAVGRNRINAVTRNLKPYTPLRGRITNFCLVGSTGYLFAAMVKNYTKLHALD